MQGFTLNHTTSSASLGLRLAGRVEIPAARRVVEDIEVAGRAGTLTRLGGWHDTLITLPLAIDLTKGTHVFDKAAVAFMSARTIGLSGEPGVFRLIKHASVSPLRRELASWGMFDVELTCAPFTYLDSGLETVTLTASGQVTNPGLIESAPIITVYGTGSLTLTINDTAYQVSAPAGQVTLDSARLVAHVAGRIQTDALAGDFPRLTPGINTFTFGAGVGRVEITGNWRSL